MAGTTLERTSAGVTCVGARHWLRASVRPADVVAGDGPGGVLTIEAAARADARWRRVDTDVVALTRAVTRLLTCDAAAARELARHATELAGVPPRDLDPVTGLVRAAYPLLAGEPPWGLGPVPATIPVDLQPAFRERSLRGAASLLFPGRATRPVVRTLGTILTGRTPVDLFTLTVAVATAPLLEPDRLVRVLDAPGGPSWEQGPLGPDEQRRLRAFLAGVAPQRRERLLRDGLGDRAERARMRFVLAESGPELPEVGRSGWGELALAVALGTAVAS